eukprot:CAMPEP_0181305866 /NCGR_PEP_ID=MMETSP1101-20121128/9972_1 /TAXON_ID=46948 /ORGANISM="Rhodomonas abbreviata, Strain Caron Lab Isolate" /LENGTH=241 /DNA_ID=CAMNT_0023411839 /DNA_START=13 /DNA_END=738 /DNA_ORIENTATION=-
MHRALYTSLLLGALLTSVPFVSSDAISPITLRHASELPMSGPVIGRDGFGETGLLSRAWNAVQGVGTALKQWPTITNSRQLLADAAPALQQPQAAAPPGNTVLKVYPIKGDGRCMFRAISRALAHSEKRPLSDKFEEEDADFLRKSAWQVICVDKRDAFEQAKVIEGNMASYCQSMTSPNFFGGEPELFVLAEELRRPITVYVPQQGGFKAIVEYGSKYVKERPRIRILYNGQNHYDALLD